MLEIMLSVNLRQKCFMDNIINLKGRKVNKIKKHKKKIEFGWVGKIQFVKH